MHLPELQIMPYPLSNPLAMDDDFLAEEVVLPIDGTLDLHPFSPKDLGSLIPDYIDECLARKIYEIRLIHGKGKGNIRRSVHAILERNPKIASFRLADHQAGGWGATSVFLRKKS